MKEKKGVEKRENCKLRGGKERGRGGGKRSTKEEETKGYVGYKEGFAGEKENFHEISRRNSGRGTGVESFPVISLASLGGTPAAAAHLSFASLCVFVTVCPSLLIRVTFSLPFLFLPHSFPPSASFAPPHPASSSYDSLSPTLPLTFLTFPHFLCSPSPF